MSDSQKINHIENLLPHLKRNSEKRTEDYLKLTHKTCKNCNEEKEIQNFEYGRNTCLVCRAISKKENYLKKRKPSK